MLFNKIDHTYFEDDVQFLPVSDWVKRYCKPFDSKTIAKAMAKKQGVKPQYFLDKWGLKRDYAANYGNAIHEAIEYWIDYKEFPDHPHLRDAVESFIKVLKKLYPGKTIKKIVSEMIVRDKKTLIAGTLDVVVGLGNNIIDVLDVKTNGNFDKPGRNRMLPPFQMLKDSNLNKGKLQVSMYYHLLKSMKLKPRDTYIIHWGGSAFRIIKVKVLDLTEALLVNKK